MAIPPDGLTRDELIQAVDWTIQQRRTRKVMDGMGWEAGDAEGRILDLEAFDALLGEAIAVAGWAPFHYAACSGPVPEPWRFYVFNRPALDGLLPRMGSLLLGKLPKILGGAGAMVHATWIPEVEAGRKHVDWEHAAAAAAAVQNLLLAAEARGLGTYWCTAKSLASDDFARLCGIPVTERYMGSLVVGKPLPPAREAEEGFQGKHRDKRTAPGAGWSTWMSAEGSLRRDP